MICDVCSASVTRDGLPRHFRIHHTSVQQLRTDDTYICDRCDAVNYRKDHLFRHYSLVHVGGDLPNTCGQCGQAFKDKHHLTQHVSLSHQHRNPAQICCNECGSAQSSKGRMFWHFHRRHHAPIIDHGQSRNTWSYACDMCGAEGLQRDNLVRHIQRKHLNFESPSFSCHQCNYVSTLLMDVHEHIKRKHLSIKRSYKRYIVACCVCDNVYTGSKSKQNMNEHWTANHT